MAVISMTDDEKLELSLRLDDAKGPFERSLERALNAIFAIISAEIAATYTTFGALPDLESYRLELESILKSSYRRSGAFFSSTFQRTLREVEPTSPQNAIDIRDLQEVRSEEEDDILLLLLPFYNIQARVQAGYILDTTTRIMRDVELDVISQEVIDAAKPGAEVAPKTQEEVGKEIAREVGKRNRTRSPNISEDQIGNVAQKAQNVEATQTAQSARRKPIPIDPFKQWITTFIRSRESHIAAHLQKRPLNELYVVQGQLLAHPKDSSRGATLDNTANCRCNSYYTM